MGVWLRGERAEGRSRDASNEEITYQRVFVVETDNDHIGARTVSYCPGLPFVGYPYVTSTEVDLLCRCTKRNARPVGNSRRLWEVTVDYSSKHDDPEQEDSEEQAIEMQPPEVSYDFAVRMKALTKADLLMPSSDDVLKADAPIVNAAGEPFNPPPEDEEHYPILTITRNELLIPETLREYIGSVNDDTFLGGAKETVKIAGLSSRKQYDKGVRYWRTTYTLEFKEDKWIHELLNIGSFYLQGDPKKRHAFETNDNPPQPYLGLLQVDGTKLPDGGTPTYERFRTKKLKDFSVLNLEAAVYF